MRTGDIHSGRTFAIHGRGVYRVALTLMLLTLAACGARTNAPTASTRATTTATPIPHLAFRPIAPPPGFDHNSGSIAASPVDGKDAWACAAAGNGAFQVWATTDGGSTWHAAGQLHPTTPLPVSNCRIVADQHETQAAVFTVTWGSGEACSLASMSFYTRDSGQHWQQLPGWTSMSSAATDGATVYALLTIITPFSAQTQPALLESISLPRLSAPGPCPTPQQQIQVRSGFMVSSDGLHTWRELHPGGSTSHDTVLQFWRSPTSGELFAATNGGALWHSPDGGENWSQMSTSGMQIGLGRWLAGRQAWMFCGGQGQPPVTMCSMDTGNTWRQTPSLRVTVHTPCDAWCHQKGGQDSQTFICQTFGIEADGSLLATCPLDHTSSAPAQFMAYRFSPGTTAWAAVGQVPAQSCSFSANNILWCLVADTGGWVTVALPA